MSGVDRAEQMVSYYDCLRKTIRWYKKVALHLFDTFLFNAYCLNSKYEVDKTISLLKFRELVVTDLLGERLNEIVPRITNNSFHYFSSIPPMPEVNGYKRMIVLVDYFSKWVEAETLFV